MIQLLLFIKGKKRSSSGLVFLLFVLSIMANAQTVELSDGVGVVSKKLTVRKLERAIGMPDSIYDNSNPNGKNAAYYKLIYNGLGASFWYSTNSGSKFLKKSNLWHLELWPYTSLKMNGYQMKDLDSADVRVTFGKPKSVSFYTNETLFNYDFRKGKQGTMLRFRWNLDGSLRKIEVILANYM